MQYEVTVTYIDKGEAYVYTDVVDMTKDEAAALRAEAVPVISQDYAAWADGLRSLAVEPVNILTLDAWRSAYGDLLTQKEG